MKDVDVNKAELIKKLEENKTKHRENFENATKGYKTEVNARIKKMLDDLTADRLTPEEVKDRIFRIWQLPVPQDHTEDYEAAIEMLQMEVRSEISVTHNDFRAFVRDDWDWKKDWVASASNYTVVK
jgi:hypothetical protein